MFIYLVDLYYHVELILWWSDTKLQNILHVKLTWSLKARKLLNINTYVHHHFRVFSSALPIIPGHTGPEPNSGMHTIIPKINSIEGHNLYRVSRRNESTFGASKLHKRKNNKLWNNQIILIQNYTYDFLYVWIYHTGTWYWKFSLRVQISFITNGFRVRFSHSKVGIWGRWSHFYNYYFTSKEVPQEAYRSEDKQFLCTYLTEATDYQKTSIQKQN